jgi:hypothetical protein
MEKAFLRVKVIFGRSELTKQEKAFDRVQIFVDDSGRSLSPGAAMVNCPVVSVQQ